jgi:hypothetical protein
MAEMGAVVPVTSAKDGDSVPSPTPIAKTAGASVDDSVTITRVGPEEGRYEVVGDDESKAPRGLLGSTDGSDEPVGNKVTGTLVGSSDGDDVG